MFTNRNLTLIRWVVMLFVFGLVMTIAPSTSVMSVVFAQDEVAADSWPSRRIHPSMFFDAETERIFMFSGMTSMRRSPDLDEVWAYDTDEGLWAYMAEVQPRDALINFGFDEESRQIIVLNNAPRETWAYDLDNAEWERREPAEQPIDGDFLTIRFGAPMVYDIESDRLIFFGGGSPDLLFADTWAYDYNTDTWENMNPSDSPSPRSMYGMAYDAESDRVILWGGFMEPGVDDILMWAYDYNSNTWEALENVDGPQSHWERYGMAYLPELDRMVMFTGMLEYEDILVGPETWYYDYNNNSWEQIETENSPPPMAMYGMTYDPTIGKVVVFGGELTSKYAGNSTSDMWLYDPVAENWELVTA